MLLWFQLRMDRLPQADLALLRINDPSERTIFINFSNNLKPLVPEEFEKSLQVFDAIIEHKWLFAGVKGRRRCRERAPDRVAGVLQDSSGSVKSTPPIPATPFIDSLLRSVESGLDRENAFEAEAGHLPLACPLLTDPGKGTGLTESTDFIF